MNKFEDITKELTGLYKYKNKRYGNSAETTIDNWGYGTVISRIEEKLERIKQQISNDINDDEKIEDNLRDIVNYGIILLVKMRNDKSNNTYDRNFNGREILNSRFENRQS